MCHCFFFQAEDGIRDDLVTGVQTCALPISREGSETRTRARRIQSVPPRTSAPRSSRPNDQAQQPPPRGELRSEERRVGKDAISRSLPHPQPKPDSTHTQTQGTPYLTHSLNA